VVSVIIPTLNEATALDVTLAAVAANRLPLEVLVVDGGSTDATVAIARRHGVRVVRAARGRGGQLRAGARHARGDVLWFLHADTRPSADALHHLAAALGRPGVVGGNFRLRFDGAGLPARFLSWLYPYLGRFGLCYGDSAIFVRRDVYRKVGGFRALPLFEDLDLVRRLREYGRFARLPCEVVTSSRRFARRRFFWVFVRWVCLQVLYWMEVPPAWLGRAYAPVRG
jgi:rSAM/selenodomain-associated transferase 2